MITDIAQWLERSTNSISMIVDRMVKIGLVRRVRNKSDRRVVYVVITSKGEDALRPAARTYVELIQKTVSPLSYEDKRTLASLLKTLKYSMLECLNPEVDAEQLRKRELKQQANLIKWALQHAVTTVPETERQGGEKRKTERRR
jgi:DNA-binding MarR family transcriptional regulator